MAHFAKVENGMVTSVIVAEQEYISGLPDAELWVQTSFNTRGGKHYTPDGFTLSDTQEKALRKNFAGIEYTYDAELDAFIPPKPFQSWTLDTETCLWVPPSPEPAPTETSYYVWDEFTISWREITAQWAPITEGE